MRGLLSFPVQKGSSSLPFPFLSQAKSYSLFLIIHRLLSLAIHKEIQELSSFCERAATALRLLLWVLDAAIVLWKAQNLNFLALQRSSSWMFQLMHSHPSRALEQGCWKELGWSWPGAHQDRGRDAGGKGEDSLWCYSPWAGCHLDAFAGLEVFLSWLFPLERSCHV